MKENPYSSTQAISPERTQVITQLGTQAIPAARTSMSFRLRNLSQQSSINQNHQKALSNRKLKDLSVTHLEM